MRLATVATAAAVLLFTTPLVLAAGICVAALTVAAFWRATA